MGFANATGRFDELDLSIGETPPDMCMKDQFGNDVSLWQFYGQLILLDVSSEFQVLAPDVEEIWTDYKDQGFMYLTLLDRRHSIRHSIGRDSCTMGGRLFHHSACPADEKDIGTTVPTANPLDSDQSEHEVINDNITPVNEDSRADSNKDL